MVALAAVAWRIWQRSKPEPVVEVVTCYPGMPASSIEKTITNRIERWVNQAHGASAITSRSLTGVSIVRVSFRNDIDLDAALAEVNQLVQGVQPALPPNTLPPLVLPRDLRYSEPLGMLGVSSDTADEATLQLLAAAGIRHQLLDVPGAVGPFVLGKKEYLVVINLDPKKMTTRKVSPKDVRTALETHCEEGRLSFDKNELLIQANFRFLRRDELHLLHELRIRARDGEMVRLDDLGTVQDQSTPPTVRFRIDGRLAVGVPVYLQTGAPRQEVFEKLTATLPSLRLDAEMFKAQLRWVPLGAQHKWLHTQDDGLLKIYLRAPSNSRLSNTEKRVAAVEGFLEKSIPAKEREAIISEVGMTPDLSMIDTVNAGPMDATILVQLSPDRTLSAAAYASKLRHLMRDEARFADLGIRFASHDMPAPVDIRIEGGSREEAMSLAQKVREQVTAIKGTVDVDIAQREDLPALLITVDRQKAAGQLLTPRDVISQIIAVMNINVSLDRNFWIDAKSNGQYFATLPYPKVLGAKLEDVLNTAVLDANAKEPIKLSSLVTLKHTTTAVEIDHFYLQRVFDVRANIEERNRSDVIADIRRMLKELKLPEGMQVELANEK